MANIEDQPVGGGGSKFNWDQIDENTNPFEIIKAKINNSPLPSNKPIIEPTPEAVKSNIEITNSPIRSIDSDTSKPSKSHVESSLQENIRQMRRLKLQQQKIKEATKDVVGDEKNIGDTSTTENGFEDNNDRVPGANHSNLSTPKSANSPLNRCSANGDSTTDGAQGDSQLNSNSSDRASTVEEVKGSGAVKLAPSSTFVRQRPERTPVPVNALTTVDDVDVIGIQEDNKRLKSTIDDMKRCIGEYERTLNQIIADRQRSEATSRDSLEGILAERDQALDELSTMERAFGDLHRRFEKSKQVIDAFKANEEALKLSTQDAQSKIKRHEDKYDTLKHHAEQKLRTASEEIETLRRSKDSEIARLHAALKRSELHVHGLEAQLQQKVAENDELTKICDELISKCAK